MSQWGPGGGPGAEPPAGRGGRRRVVRWWLLSQLGGLCLGLAGFLVGLTAGFDPPTWLTVRAVEGSPGQMTDRLVTGGSTIGDPW